MTIAQISQTLLPIYDQREAQSIAYWLIEYLTGCTPSQQRQQAPQLDTTQNTQLQQFLNELLQHKPIQYVLGESYFYGLKFIVSPAVLIPRPETEELVAWVKQTFPANSSLRAIDIGTGSGCIAITLQHFFPNWTMTAADISRDALTIAQQNAQQYQQNVQFVRVDITDDQQYDLLNQYDLIVSNPPYIPCSEQDAMAANVVQYEPHQALFTPNDQADLFYNAILNFAENHLAENGYVFFEIHEDFAQQILSLCQQKKQYATQLRQDLYGKNRMIRLYKI